jgi:hypothetical protein
MAERKSATVTVEMLGKIMDELARTIRDGEFLLMRFRI